ncbi:MAG: protein kinase [Minicystis sp.]
MLDFGVAKLVSDDAAHRTATGAAIGTPSYMAPEQCRGKPVDHRADIYALGVVIHEMLTGERLFQGESAMDILMKHVSEPPRPMSAVCPSLPKELDAPVLAMLAKSPHDRPDSAGVAVAALAGRARLGVVEVVAGVATAEPTSFERTLARRDAATVMSVSPGLPVVASDAASPEREPGAGRPPGLRPDEPGSGRPPGLRPGEPGYAPGPIVAAAATPSEATPALGGGTEVDRAAIEAAGDDVARPDDAGADDAPRADDTRLPEGAPQPDEAAAAQAARVLAASADGRFAISSKGNTIKVWDLRTGQAVHTFPGQVDPAAGPKVPGQEARDPARALGPSSRGAGTASGARAPQAKAKPAGRTGSWALLAGGAAILAAVGFMLKSRAPASPIATAETAPARTSGRDGGISREPELRPDARSALHTAGELPSDKVTVRVAVTPADADVILDGLRVGKASDPLVLPRSDRRSALRFEKSGFEAQTVWIVPDHDSALPPIALQAAPASAPSPGPAFAVPPGLGHPR